MATVYWTLGYPARSEWLAWMANFETHGPHAEIAIGCVARASPTTEYAPAAVGAILARARALGMPAMPHLVVRPEHWQGAEALKNLWNRALWAQRAEMLTELAAHRTPGRPDVMLDLEIYNQAVKSQVNLHNGDQWLAIVEAMAPFLETLRAHDVVPWIIPATEQSQFDWAIRAALGSQWWGLETYDIPKRYLQLTAAGAPGFAGLLAKVQRRIANFGLLRTRGALGFYQTVLRDGCASFRRAMEVGVERYFVFFNPSRAKAGFGTPKWYADTAADGIAPAADAATRDALAAEPLRALRGALAFSQRTEATDAGPRRIDRAVRRRAGGRAHGR